jgi:hypothetical protein
MKIYALTVLLSLLFAPAFIYGVSVVWAVLMAASLTLLSRACLLQTI